MAEPVQLYRDIGGAAGCRAFATAFYNHVERDPILRPLFPSTFRCAIEAFAAFLVQFLGGEAEATQYRWHLSLRESHDRFSIGPRQRTAWLRAMAATLDDHSLIADARVRSQLLQFFEHSSTHVVNQGKVIAVKPIHGELAQLWEEQLALDEAVALVHSPDQAQRCLELLKGPALQARFERSSEVRASFLALAATAKAALLREFVVAQIRAHPSLVHERYRHRRTLLHDASAAGDLDLVEMLLDLGADDIAGALYCAGNECTTPAAGPIVRVLLRRNPDCVDAAHGVKRCTALHMAARRGNTDAIAALLDGGANIEARDSVGDTSLRRAVNCDKVAAAKLLLARGGDPHSIGSKSLTPDRAARSSRMREVFGWREKIRG